MKYIIKTVLAVILIGFIQGCERQHSRRIVIYVLPSEHSEHRPAVYALVGNHVIVPDDVGAHIRIAMSEEGATGLERRVVAAMVALEHQATIPADLDSTLFRVETAHAERTGVVVGSREAMLGPALKLLNDAAHAALESGAPEPVGRNRLREIEDWARGGRASW